MLTGHVIVLDLSCSQLSGTIHPNNSLFQLHHLHTLNLANNEFSSFSIPHNIGRLTNLRHLNFSYSYFHGKLPTEMSYLSNLVSLDLSSSSIDGSQLDQRTFETMLQNFTNLEVLYLSRVNISSPIPVNISSSSLRYVDLEYTNLRGVLTERFYLLPNLRNLKLGGNVLLKGVLPKFHPSNTLLELDISFTGISFELSDIIGTFSSLNMLKLRGCQLSGSIPDSIGNLTQLKELHLDGNNLTGHIPSSILSLTHLEFLELGYNSLSVPMSLLNCDYLEILDVGNNAINDTFPAWLGMLQKLQVLILKSNRFHGPISTTKKFYFPRLRIFDNSCNEFSVSLPAVVFHNFKAMIKLDDGDKGEIKYMEQQSEFSTYEDSVSLVIKGNDMELEKISTIMTAIDLSSNRLEGVIQKSLKDLGSLRLLNLSHNNLNGDIPMEMRQLNALEALDLSWNQLTGKIPQELTRLTFLEKLNLSHNLLVGPIPQGPQFNTFENDSYGGNLDLCGPPLSKQCGTSDPSHVPQPLEEEEEEESNFFSGFTWESVVIGYTFGLIVGTVVWSLMFKYRKPKQIVEFFEGIFPKKMRRPKKQAQIHRT